MRYTWGKTQKIVHFINLNICYGHHHCATYIHLAIVKRNLIVIAVQQTKYITQSFPENRNSILIVAVVIKQTRKLFSRNVGVVKGSGSYLMG